MDARELIVRLDDLEAAASRDHFAAAPARLGVSTLSQGGVTVLRAPTIPSPMLNRVIGLGNHAEASDDDIDGVLAAIGPVTLFVHVGPAARPSDLRARLETRGLAPASRPSWVKVARGREPAPAVDTELDVRELGPDHADAFGRVATVAFEMPPSLAPWFAALVGRPRWRVFGAFAGDELAGVGALFLDGEAAWVGIGGTLPAHRGRRAQRAVMARRIDAAIGAGCTLIATETGEPAPGTRNPSLDNMIACGFRPVCVRLNLARR